MTTKGLNSAVTADAYLSRNPDIVTCDRDCYRFNGAYYEPQSHAALTRSITDFVRSTFKVDDATSRLVEETAQAAEHRTAIDKGWQPYWLRDPGKTPSVLVVQNGVLDLQPMYDSRAPQLGPHTPDLYATTISDAHYDPQAGPCSKFAEFLNWMAGGKQDVITLLLQFIAYILLRGLDLQRLLILVGSGANGKSTLLNVIRKLVGAGNFAALPIDRLGQRFALVSLFGKAVNLCADLNETDKVAEGNLKMLVDGSDLSFEQKYRDVFISRNHARLIFACNQLPRFRDRTDGLWRRLLIVPCSASVDDDQIVRRLEDTFDLTGVLNMVLEAGQLLVELRDFVVPEIVLQTTEQERREMNPTKLFLLNHCTVDPSASVQTAHLYQGYRTWMELRKYQALADGNFGKELKAHFVEEFEGRQIKKGKVQYIVGRCNAYYGLKYWPDGIDDQLEVKQLLVPRDCLTRSRVGVSSEKAAAQVEKARQIITRLNSKPTPATAPPN